MDVRENRIRGEGNECRVNIVVNRRNAYVDKEENCYKNDEKLKSYYITDSPLISFSLTVSCLITNFEDSVVKKKGEVRLRGRLYMLNKNSLELSR